MQTITVLTIVALAALFVGHRAWKTVRGAKSAPTKGCGPDCGCG